MGKLAVNSIETRLALLCLCVGGLVLTAHCQEIIGIPGGDQIATRVVQLPVDSSSMPLLIGSHIHGKTSDDEKSGIRAMLISAFFPGMGQVYSGRYLSGVLWLVVETGFVGGTYYLNTVYKKRTAEYEDALHWYKNSKDIEETRKLRKEVERRYEEVDSAFEHQQIVMGVAIAFWVYNIFDALILMPRARTAPQMSLTFDNLTDFKICLSSSF